MEFIKIYFFIITGITSVATFSWNDCGSVTDPFRVTSLDVSSNGHKMLYVTGKAKLAINVTGSIQANISMQKKFFWGWAKIPCVDNLGSCTYDDICNLSPYIDKPCPTEFASNDLPCRCPILEGQYMGKKFPIDLSMFPSAIEKGKYRIRLTVHKAETELLCLLMYLTL